jgi:3-oxoacyl-[acyl-carrier protein] reductase/2-deoxy-D-gluconate 3-dehydrogenase
VLGAALGIATETGIALVLYTERGFLGTAGFLVALSLAALALGIWVGAERATPIRRWLGAIIAFALAGIFAVIWTRFNGARLAGWTGALAALFLLAEPAYTSGALLSSLTERYRSVAASALLGAAFGVLLASLILIPRLSAGVILVAAAIALTLVAMWDVSRARYPLMNNTIAMTNKVALITGVGSSGQVGYIVAQQMIAAGARVCITGLHAQVHELARQLGHDTLAVQADLTDGHAVAALIDQVQDQCGRLDVLVNVAGGLSVIKPLAETETDEWRRELQRNAETAFTVTRAALPLLREARGAVINFASPAGLRAQPQLGAYSAAKAAVVALTRALAIEEKQHGVRVNALAPGMIDTEQNRQAAADPASVKWVSREEVAAVVLFLASDAAGGVTGEVIHVLGEGIS